MTTLPILNYHAIDHSGSVISTSPEWFDQTMNSLHAEGFRCVDLASWIKAGRPHITRGFAITFDDGLISIRSAADTIARFGFTATAFLVTGRMGHNNSWPGQPAHIPTCELLAWNDLENLNAAGIRFGAHTRTHVDLGRLSPQEIREEILESRDTIEQRTGALCRLFAYPYGIAPKDAQDLVLQEFDAGLGTNLAYATDLENQACLSRIDAYYLRSPHAIKRLLNGSIANRLRLRRVARFAKRVIAIA